MNTVQRGRNTAAACSSASKGASAVVSDMGVYTSGGAVTAAVICSYNGTSYSWMTH